MSTPFVSVEGKIVRVSIHCNGYWWRFDHQRSTEADAQNLRAVINDRAERERANESDMSSKLLREIERLARSNRALRACLRKRTEVKP